MEDINDSKFYSRKIVNESRHKFIFSYNNNRTLLIQQLGQYPVTIGNDPCALYYNIDGLPRLDFETTKLDKNAISILCDEYLGFSIASELINSVICNNDLDRIKQREHILLDYVNRSMSSNNINSIIELLRLLKETKEIYYGTYSINMQENKLSYPIDKSPLSFMELNDFIVYVKRMLDKKTHISLVLDNKDDICLESYKAINSLVGSRINKDISMNILTEPDSWRTYLAKNGEFIEAIHDYENIDYDDSSTIFMMKMKKKYKKQDY